MNIQGEGDDTQGPSQVYATPAPQHVVNPSTAPSEDAHTTLDITQVDTELEFDSHDDFKVITSWTSTASRDSLQPH